MSSCCLHPPPPPNRPQAEIRTPPEFVVATVNSRSRVRTGCAGEKGWGGGGGGSFIFSVGVLIAINEEFKKFQ